MFDESKHPRAPKGSSNGGQFTSSDGAGGTHEATEAEKRRMQELGITESGGKDRKSQTDDSNKTSIREQVKAEQEKLKNTKVLAIIPKQATAIDFKKAIAELQDKLSKDGGVVKREGFDDVQVSSRLKDAKAYLKTAAEVAAVSVIPDVIKKGVLINQHTNHKGRDYVTYTFAGNVSIGGKEGVVAVVVKKQRAIFTKYIGLLHPTGKT